MNEIGAFALGLALVVAGYASAAAFAAARWPRLGGRARQDWAASARNGAYVCFGLTSVAAAALVHALVTRDFSLQAVAHYTSRDLSPFYTVTAFWAGQSGSLLLWAWLLSAFAAVVAWQQRRRPGAFAATVTGVLGGILTFFLALLVYVSNPFARLPYTPPDGAGLNPMLHNPGMVIHPPTLYLGYVGFAVPFAFAMAALLTGRLDAAWIRSTRRWTLLSWLALTLGNLFGAQWAYLELGWGGYWAWDPVENASFMPWLTGTAFLHSVMIQEKRGMLKVWNVFLVILTFGLTIFGTFITRSGIIASVHAFGVSDLGPLFLAFLATTVSAALLLTWYRRDLLASEHRIEAFLSREASFLLNNLLLLGLAFATFWGTLFPVISEAVTGDKVTVGPPFFNQVNLPIGLALLALTGVCPLLAWRRSTAANLKRNFLLPAAAGVATGLLLLVAGLRDGYGLLGLSLAAFVLTTIVVEFAHGTNVRRRYAGESAPRALSGLVSRNRRRYGGYVVHVGVVLVAAGVAGSAFNTQTDLYLAPGETAAVEGYDLTYRGPRHTQEPGRTVDAAHLALARDGEALGGLRPERATYARQGQTVSEVAIYATAWHDLYVILGSLTDDGRAFLQVFYNPLVGWIWAGGWVMVAGTLIAIWPDRRRRRQVAGSRAPRDQVAAPSPRRRRAAAATAAVVLLAAWAAPAAADAVAAEIAGELACQCGCGMTAASCTHDSCGSAEGIRAEVARLVAAGHSRDEILADFARRYGDAALAAPPKRGFSLSAWVLPFAAIGVGGLGLYGLLSRWRRAGETPPDTAVPDAPGSQYLARVRRELTEEGGAL